MQPRDIAPEIQGMFAHRKHRGEGGGGGAVLDHALIGFGQTEALTQPVEHARLHLGRRRRGLPEHALRCDERGDEFGKDRGRSSIGVEIGKETRVLPMRDAGHHDPLEIGHDRVEAGAVLGWARLQQGGDVARFGLRAHGAVADRFVVVGAPIGGGLGLCGEIIPAHDVSPLRLRVPRWVGL